MKILSIISCLPSNVVYNGDLPFEKEELNKIIQQTAISKRHIVDEDTTAADLCERAAQEIIDQNKIDKNDIGVLVFVSQYPDYILPSTTHVLKHKLGLDPSCVSIQINEGCAGFLYGIRVLQDLLKSSDKNHGLLLCGDTTSKVVGNDQSIMPLFGDGASATLVEKSEVSVSIILGSDGSGARDIMVTQGFKNGYNTQPKLEMNGMNVFMFSISRVPAFIDQFLKDTNQSINDFDYVVLHQANKMMNDRIIRKLNCDETKALNSIQEFGNTSVASIPITLTSQLKDKITNEVKILISGFGVGLAWGTASITLNEQTCLDTIYYSK